MAEFGYSALRDNYAIAIHEPAPLRWWDYVLGIAWLLGVCALQAAVVTIPLAIMLWIVRQ